MSNIIEVWPVRRREYTPKNNRRIPYEVPTLGITYFAASDAEVRKYLQSIEPSKSFIIYASPRKRNEK